MVTQYTLQIHLLPTPTVLNDARTRQFYPTVSRSSYSKYNTHYSATLRPGSTGVYPPINQGSRALSLGRSPNIVALYLFVMLSVAGG